MKVKADRPRVRVVPFFPRSEEIVDRIGLFLPSGRLRRFPGKRMGFDQMVLILTSETIGRQDRKSN
jgi:hypothetical protein